MRQEYEEAIARENKKCLRLDLRLELLQFRHPGLPRIGHTMSTATFYKYIQINDVTNRRPPIVVVCPQTKKPFRADKQEYSYLT